MCNLSIYSRARPDGLWTSSSFFLVVVGRERHGKSPLDETTRYCVLLIKRHGHSKCTITKKLFQFTFCFYFYLILLFSICSTATHSAG